MSRRIVVIACLVGAWCALWGSASVANLASGAVVASVVERSSAESSSGRSIRPLGVLHLLGVVIVDLVTSTFTVALEVLRPTDSTQESIVEIVLPSDARSHLLLMVVAITLTPGTAVVDADPDRGALYLHLLHDDRRDATISHVRRLAQLVERALPTVDPHPSEVAP